MNETKNCEKDEKLEISFRIAIVANQAEYKMINVEANVPTTEINQKKNMKNTNTLAFKTLNV